MTSIPSSHLTWLKETDQSDAPSFLKHLDMIKRKTLGDKFRQWEANDADQYWLLKQSKSTKTKVATVVIKESESISVAALQGTADSKSHEKDAIQARDVSSIKVHTQNQIAERSEAT
ncbi:hypothetical protein BGZ46_005833, partial [Entomortierella lignicola]